MLINISTLYSCVFVLFLYHGCFIFNFFYRKGRKGVAKVAEFFLCKLCVKTWRSLRFLFFISLYFHYFYPEGNIESL